MSSTQQTEIAGLAEKIRAALELKTPVDAQQAVERLGGSIEDFWLAADRHTEH